MTRKKDRKRKLDALVAHLQGLYGAQALRRAARPAGPQARPCIPTGFDALDTALGIGGLPRGRITELIGPPTSGKTTVALKTIAQAQAAGNHVAVIDLEHAFNPDYAARAGVDLSRMVLVPPRDPGQALDVTRALIVEGGLGMVVFSDTSALLGYSHAAAGLAALLRQITQALHASSCVLAFLTTPIYETPSGDDYPSGFALAHFAAVRLRFQVVGTIRRRDGRRGYHVQVTTLKNKVAPGAGNSVTLDITFNGTVASNGIL